ncbi:homoserine kinase [Nocardioides gilvus]|uniref:homoserine kinase n=1 Tax=Nocardioides gilvus TaxID=1735589 RepID=UPI000D74C0EE|nr:homoserine kinase [Nocardioides gilvus]
MAPFVEGPVTVSVPATSANLGPGFDALGLALSSRDELTAEVTAGGIEVDVRGCGAEDVPRDESHLVVRAMRMGFRAMGTEPQGFTLECKNVIPHTRGMGSSSAAIVGGLVLARAMVAGGQLLLDDDAIFRLAAGLEGHPDNVAPAMYGGFTIAGDDNGRWFALKMPVDPRVTTVTFVPTEPVATKVARGLLPSSVPHAAAAANAGRAALLVAALSSRPDWLLTATEDKLHQDYREPAMPESLALIRQLRADGFPAVVSGAGPTVLALTDLGSVDELIQRSPAGWATRHLLIDQDGARVE